MDEKRRVKITDTTMRDGHQSLLATRMRIEHMLPICEKIDQVGFHSLEVWGGATFDSCMRFLNEDPWERLRILRRHLKTPLQMLLRGQNVVGYKHYPDDVLTEFIKKTVYNGLDIFRIFDALNDVRNMQKAIEVVKQEGAHAQATVVYTISPVHNVEYYVKTAKTLEEMGADSICLKDMAGILAPQPAYEIIKEWKSVLKIPVQLHCHYTSGMAAMAYLRAIDAGVDVIDCAISTMALQTSQPAVETMVAALQGTPYDTGLDLKLLTEIAEHFKEVRKHYKEFDVASKSVDANVMIYQIPGGMMSNFISQLSQQNALHRLPEVLEELPRVRKEFGYPPLVTPSSQIVGTQAVLNVLMGRYKLATNEVKQYMRGFYGQPPAPVDEEVRRMIIGDEEPITCRPADLLEPGLPEARKEAAPYMQKEEDVISVALFPQVAPQFLKERLAKKLKVDLELAAQSSEFYPA
ncbi:oxaloacetate decarboxylase subunit alpha [Desulfofundulus thermobenzoicus]|uniref:Oxaloacetate decarboxylase subunit alpha n=1 Tax=Desulfofundulus thermobenzoicus TaxID=29376 RepID=A0A6N7IQR4_9FIRM|nr:oxaloacetate decarboxylase subunit alpha [Desulfofundulus thermobenzoicus]MQL52406.1 oxaloacetate decarboxylase subunit alpha [Desulfofundulus thermobenzoicus]HHW42999.1 oxaloacetate decarboxylase subunit alpha [Desulfotomaculum sp.]